MIIDKYCRDETISWRTSFHHRYTRYNISARMCVARGLSAIMTKELILLGYDLLTRGPVPDCGFGFEGVVRTTLLGADGFPEGLFEV